MIRCYIAAALVLMMAGCGSREDGHGDSTGGEITLHAAESLFVQLSLPPGVFSDSVVFVEGRPSALLLSSGGSEVVLSSFIADSCGHTVAGRLDRVAEAGAKNTDSVFVRPHDDFPGYSAAIYVSGDSSVVERIWNRGAGELLILQARSGSTSMNILLNSVSAVFSTAEPLSRAPAGSMGIYLSDRTRTEIVEQVNSDVSPPPEIEHRIELNVEPLNREMSVLDTMTVDFRTTQSRSSLTMYFPRCDNGTGFQPLRGEIENHGDSVVCIGDSARVFTGVYSGSWNGFIGQGGEIITRRGMQLNPSLCFQCGMWFYPGCAIPSSYRLRITVPDKGYDIYAPLDRQDIAMEDSLLTATYVSPPGGINGPLAWAAGGFQIQSIADGRSSFICLGSDSSASAAGSLAHGIAEIIWNLMDYDNARLDFVIVRSLDLPVMITGPGCIFISSDLLEKVQGSEEWIDSLAAGRRVPATEIVFNSALAHLSGSTYLTVNLRDALAAWVTYRFLISRSPESAPTAREAFMKYYLYETGMIGGIEYAIADPALDGSLLRDPVITGKAPMVLEFLSSEIPAFRWAIPRALENLRHAGDSFGRFFSALGLSESSLYGEFFLSWIYRPGIPRIEILWHTADDILTLRVLQHQPGPDFPLGSTMDKASVAFDAGWRDLDLERTGAGNVFYATLPEGMGSPRALNIDPENILPADIVYRRITAGTDEI